MHKPYFRPNSRSLHTFHLLRKARAPKAQAFGQSDLPLRKLFLIKHIIKQRNGHSRNHSSVLDSKMQGLGACIDGTRVFDERATSTRPRFGILDLAQWAQEGLRICLVA
jgi:hypothetical protein